MIKAITTGEIRKICEDLFPIWEESRKQIKCSGKTTYNIIKLKKELEKHLITIQDTVMTMAEQSGGIRQDNGSYRVPEDKVEELNTKLSEFSESTIEIEYSPIALSENDEIPPVVMDALFDFIEMD